MYHGIKRLPPILIANRLTKQFTFKYAISTLQGKWS